jgi:drug/metabolite transporter (DMT)-like permease
MLFALALGYLVFGELPSMAVLAGAAIIMAAGVFVVMRERAIGLRRPPSQGGGS